MVTRCGGLGRFFLLFLLFFLSDTKSAFGQAQPRVVEAVNNARRVVLTGNVHPLARAEFDRGAADDSLPMARILLLLRRSDDREAALKSYMEQQQDKSSANYHVWLTPEQFGAQFGPADADVQAVRQWLESQGFRIEKVYSGKTVIEFSGTAGQVGTAFGAAIRNYQVNGKMYVANANDPQIPTALAPVVAGVVSLNSFPRQSHALILGHTKKILGRPGLEPLYTFPNPFTGQGDFYGLAPGDFAKIYNSTPLIQTTPPIDGTGQMIAIVQETNLSVADVQSFRQMFGLPATFTAGNVILNGEDPGITSTSEEGEADLDTQWAGAVAPGATVDMVVSASTPASAGIDLSALYIIEHNLAGVMSESYGTCEGALGSTGNAFYNSLWEQAAAQGITVILSAGDGGSAGCDDFNTATTAQHGLAVSGLASTPFNVAVGGTDFDQVNQWSNYWSTTNATAGTDVIGTSALSYIPEIPWSQNCAQIGLTGCGTNAPQGSVNIVAGAGGASGTYGKPSWQLGVTGMPNDNHRDLPDVSLFASPGFNGSGYIICQADANHGTPCNLNAGQVDFVVVGGTSASAPAFAGVMALVNQKQATAQNPTPRQGNANYVLYALAKKAGASCTSSSSEATGCIFNDVTHGNSHLPTGVSGVGTNSVPCQGGSPNCSTTVANQTGVLVETASPTTEAWTVTAGYDLVTGLGSVNINNLATNWGTVNTVATTTSLTLTPPAGGITHGINENVSVNIAVTPTSGTATGDVSLIAKFSNGITQGLDKFTLSAGKVSGTTSSLPGGTNYQVYAHYAGDGTNAPSDSSPVTVSVAQESSQTFIVVPTFSSTGGTVRNGNATSFVYGTPYSIRMYVTDKNGMASATGPPSPTCSNENLLTCPTGMVTLMANSSPVDGGTFALNNAGYTRDLAPTLGGGTYALGATYSGDYSYGLSMSATDSITITAAPTSQQWTNFPNQIPIGQQFSLGVGVGTGVAGVAPTGAVTFYDGNAALSGPVTYMAQGVGSNVVLYATGTVSLSTAGSHTITAQYGGDANYGPSTSPPVTVRAQYPTTIKVTESSTTINYGQSVTITATVTSSGKTPPMSGQLSIFYGSTNLTPVTTTFGTDASGNQVLTGTATTVPQFTEATSANFNNDPLYVSGTAFGDAVTVNIPDFSIPNGVPLNVTAGQTVTETVMVTPLSTTPSTVTLNIQNGTPPPGFTLTLSSTTVNLNGTAVPVTLTIATQGISAAAAVRTASIQSDVELSRQGKWWSLSICSALAILVLLAVPRRSYRYQGAVGGAAFFICVAMGCGGGGGGGGGGSGQVTPSISIATSSARLAFQSNATLTATVTSSRTLSGTVAFAQNGVNFATGVPLVNGQATVSLSNQGLPQIVTLTASYSGDANNLPAQTPAGVVEVFQGTLPILVQGQTGGLTRNATFPVTLQ